MAADADLEALLARIQADRAEAEAQLKADQKRLDELISWEKGVETAVQALRKYGQGSETVQQEEAALPQEAVAIVPEPEPAEEPDWAALTNMDAAAAALMAIGHTATTRQVQEKLQSVGRAADFEQTRSALGYLKRKGRLSEAPTGLWGVPIVIEPPDESLAKPPTGMNAARQVLQADTSRSWTVREVWDEQVRQGWVDPEEDGREAVRLALKRLREKDPQVQVKRDEKGLAFTYRWISSELAPSNGSGHGGA
jgi:hypothetical protein